MLERKVEYNGLIKKRSVETEFSSMKYCKPYNFTTTILLKSCWFYHKATSFRTIYYYKTYKNWCTKTCFPMADLVLWITFTKAVCAWVTCSIMHMVQFQYQLKSNKLSKTFICKCWISKQKFFSLSLFLVIHVCKNKF